MLHALADIAAAEHHAAAEQGIAPRGDLEQQIQSWLCENEL